MGDDAADFPDPFFEIAALKDKFPADFKLSEQRLASIAALHPFPYVQENEILPAKARFKETRSYTTAMRMINFRFPFCPDLIDFFNNSYFTDPSSLSYITLFTLYSYNSWMIIYEKTKSPEYLGILLNAMKKYMESSNSMLLIYAYIKLISIFIEVSGQNDLNIIFPSIKSLLSYTEYETESVYSLLPILVKRLINDNPQEIPTLAIEIIEFFYQNANKHSANKIPAAATQIIQCLIPFIIKLNKTSLKYYAVFSKYYDLKSANNFVYIIARAIIEYIIKSDLHLDLPTNQPKLDMDFPKTVNISISYKFSENEINYKFNINSANDLFDIQRRDINIVETNIAHCLEFITVAIHDYDELVIIFINELSKLMGQCDKCIGTALAVFVYTCDLIINKRTMPLKELTEYMIHPDIFDLNVVCLAENMNKPEFQLINEMRRMVIRDLAGDDDSVGLLLNHTIKSPLLFSETLFRFMELQNLILPAMRRSLTVAKAFAEYIVMLREHRSQNIEMIDVARTSLFKFLSVFLTDPKTQSHFFNDNYFPSIFIGCVFEPELTDFTIREIKNYLASTDNYESKMTPIAISQVISMLVLYFPNQREVNLANQIVHSLNDVLMLKPNEAKFFSSIVKTLLTGLAKLNDSDECRSFFLICIQLFVTAESAYTLQLEDLHFFESGIRACFSQDSPHELFTKLIEYLSGDLLATDQTKFTIKQPYVLNLMFSIFKSQNKLEFICNYILGLCTFTKNNCLILHRSEFDLYIVDQIINIWEEADQKDMEALFKLFIHIASYISSPAVVQRFVSLLCPKYNIFPKYYEMPIEAIKTMFNNANKEPRSTIALIPDQTNKLTTTYDITREFNFVTWINIGEMNDNYFPTLFKGIDKSGRILAVHLIKDNLAVSDGMPASNNVMLLGSPLSTQGWNFIAIKYTQGSVVVYINDNPPYSCDLPYALRVSGATTFTFGGVSMGSAKPRSSSYMGPFGLFKFLKTSQISMLSKKGVSYIRRTGEQPIFIILTYRNKPVSANFVNVLSTQCRPDIILPLFTQVETKFADGTKYPKLLESTIEILTNILLWSEEVEKCMYETKGFSIIASILHDIPYEHINFELYESFYTLLLSLSYEPLQKQLIKEILVNIELWVITTPDDQIHIYSHWASQLFLNFYDVMPDIIPFTTLLTYSIIYYRDDDNDPVSKFSEQTRFYPFTDFQPIEVRKILYQVLQIMATKKFSIDDHQIIFSYCISSNNTKLILELIQMVDQMIHSVPSPFSQLTNGRELITPMLTLLQKSLSDIAIVIIDTIIDFYQAKYLKDPSIRTLMNIIMRRIKPAAITNQFVVKITQLMNTKCPELMPVLCWCISKMQNLSEFDFSNLVPDPIYTKDPFWPIWPLSIYPSIDIKNMMTILRFIILCDPKCILKGYSAIEVCARSMGFCSHRCKRIYISEITNMVNDNQVEKSEEFIRNYASIVKSFLFTKHDRPNNSLVSAFLQSPFADQVKFEVKDGHQKINMITAEDLMDAFLGIPLGRHKYDFGLRLKQNFNLEEELSPQKEQIWPDADVALRCLTVLSHFPQQCAQLHAFICYFLVDVFPKEVSQQIDLITENGKNTNAIADLVYAKIKTGEESITQQKLDALGCYAYSLPTHVYDNFSNMTLKFKNFIQKTQNISLDFFQSFSDSMHQAYKVNQDQVLKLGKSHSASVKRLWRYVFSSLTIEYGPWEYATDNHTHFKRDKTLCYNFCPFKLKKNWNFTDHAAAAMSRDKGEMCIEQEMKAEHIIEGDDFKQEEPQKKIIAQSRCQVITVRSEKEAEISLFNTEVSINCKNHIVISISYKEIEYIMPRLFLHLPYSFEIFTFSGESYLIVLPSEQLSKLFISKIESRIDPQAKNESHRVMSDASTNDWVKGKITTFEYIMNLNLRSSRSFNAPSQYPLYPWVLKDFTSDKLDLLNDNVFRDLSKPVGAMSEERLNTLLIVYKDLNEMEPPGHLYSCGPMCPLVVFLHMIRIEPFTTMHIDLQSGRFDCAQRIFSSIPHLWQSVCNDPNDYRELNPEFYYSPEFLLNLDNFDLGVQDEYPNCNVELPKWASSPIDFIYKHRKALESDYVSEHINDWIDLIWGYKQKGQEAINANNIYLKDLYDNIWTTENLKNPKRRAQIEASKTFLGQIPKQLFTAPHPKRSLLKHPKVEIKREIGIDTVAAVSYDDFNIISLLSRNGSIYSMKLDNNRNEITERKISGFMPEWIGDFTENFGKGKIMIKAQEQPSIRIIDVKNATVHIVPRSAQCASGSDRFIIVVSVDNIIYFYSDKDIQEEERSVPFYREAARCCCVSDVFHVAIIASREGSLIIHSLEHESHVHSINLGNCTPRLVSVTPSWGFIVCVSTRVEEGSVTNWISVYTINGHLIKQSKQGFDVTKVICFSSPKRFDYIAIANSRGLVYIAEVYTLDFTLLQLPTKGRIVHMSYTRELQAICVITELGEIAMKNIEFINNI